MGRQNTYPLRRVDGLFFPFPLPCTPELFPTLPAPVLTLSLPFASSFLASVLLLPGAFQYHTICAASTALSAKAATKPYRISGSSTSCSVVKMRLREPAR